ncbi:carbohydrate sulfotransferase 10-like isoform X2 [Palaemon carinicauda]|uniref:carbohydrate sulfotransferase 10-like isoform X2 n=1 Tax=Palaemon carinicauda TaxID=392227 RepID=UPI0035B5C930
MTNLGCFRRESLTVRKAILLTIAFTLFNFVMLGKESKTEESSSLHTDEKSSLSLAPDDEHRNITDTEVFNTTMSGIKTYVFKMRSKTNKMGDKKNKMQGKKNKMQGKKKKSRDKKNKKITGRKNNSKTSKTEKDKRNFLEDKVIVMDDVWTEEQMAAQAKIFADREAALDAFCEQTEDKPSFLHNISDVHANIRWVPKHNLIWCPVYKAGSTTWMTNLLLLAGIKSTNSSLHKQVRKLYPPPEDLEERQRLLDTSMRMLIVRHPLERLLSAYRDKMLRDNQFQKVSNLVKTGYSDPSAKEDDAHPTFLQFLKYIKDIMKKFWNSEGKSRVNPHWQPVWWTCGPCQIKYDAIAHMETLMVDQEYIIRKAGLKDLAINAHTHSSNLDSYNGTNQATRDYFSRIPKTLIKQVSNLYRHDFQLFGYTPEEYIKMGTD